MLRIAIALLVMCSLVAAAAAATRGHADSPAPGTIDTIAGGGTQTGEGIPATDASMDAPIGIAVNAAGEVFFTELVTCTVYKVSQEVLSIYAGTGTCPQTHSTDIGDGGPATSGILHRPYGIALDNEGNLYIADTFNCAIRQVDALTGVITTVAGAITLGCGFSGDGGPATEAMLFNPQAVAIDASGNIFTSDTSNCRVREVSGGIINTIAGDGVCSYAGDGGPAISAHLSSPLGIAVDGDSNVYIVDDCRIREVTGGLIDRIAGTGDCGFNGDGPALSTLISPYLIAADPAGRLYLADDTHCRIRELSSGMITTIAGRNIPTITDPFPDCGYSGDGGLATDAQVQETAGVALDTAGNVYLTEWDCYCDPPDGSGHVRVVYDPLDAPATPTYTPTETPMITPTPKSTPTATPTRVPSCADIDRSGTVTTVDILYVVRHYRSADLTADLNSDGAVTTADIMMVLHRYGKAC